MLMHQEIKLDESFKEEMHEKIKEKLRGCLNFVRFIIDASFIT